MKIKLWEKIIGSGLYTGFIPFTPGTFGSLAALLIYFIPGFEKPVVIIPVIIISIFLGIYIGNKFEPVYGKDPGQFTYDEFVGMWISLLFAPKTIINALFIFILWRFFDIIKPFPARRFEKFKGGLGIMADDVAAAVYTLIVAQVILNVF